MLNVFAISLLLLSMPLAFAAETLGATRIARWQGDRQAAFVLMFDDSCLSHVQHVVPALTARGLTGTFYVNPGSGQWAAKRQAWEKDIPAAGMDYGNHTMTHKGIRGDEEAEREIGGCSEVITKLFPGTKLISWGQPGGIKPENWTLTKDQLAALLKAKNLIPRPDFGGRGAMAGVNNAAQMMGLVDKAVKTGGMEAVIFHGVGGDWITTPLPVFTEFIDELAKRRDQVWITGHIKAHQYATERDGATVTVDKAGAKGISLTLASTADAALYDQPLTLVTAVPAAWKRCTVTQGATKSTVEVSAGSARFDALPGGGPIVLANGG